MKIRNQESGIRDQLGCRGYAAPDQQPGRSADKNLIPDSCPLIPERGFTLIELIVVITIVVILASVLLNRVLSYQEQAEKAAMQQVASALQSALTMKYARLMTGGIESKAATLAIENPMNWLAKIPDNYSGEFYDVTPRSVAPGNWVFDLKTRNLIYVVNRGDYFTPEGKSVRKAFLRSPLEFSRVSSRTYERSGCNPGQSPM